MGATLADRSARPPRSLHTSSRSRNANSWASALRRLLLTGIGLAVLVPVACTDHAGSGTPAGRSLSLPTVSDTLAPDLVIGREDGRPEEAFGRIADIEVGSEGTIYVIDQQASAVRVFDAGGSFVRSIGREGEGPGEFQRPGQIALSPDGGVWVYDYAMRTVIALDSLGRETDRFAATASGPQAGPLSFIWDGRIAEDGTLVQTVQRAKFTTGESLEEADNSAFVRRLDPESGHVDSTLIAEDPIRRYRYSGEGPGGGVGTYAGLVSFDPRRLLAVGPGGEVWTALSTEYVLTRISPRGDTLTIRVDDIDNAAGSEELDYWERLSGNVPELAAPTRRHVLSRLFVDSDGSLWVHRADGYSTSGRLDVFEADGSFRGSVVVPATFSLTVRDGRVYAAAFDDLGIGRVMRIPVPPQ